MSASAPSIWTFQEKFDFRLDVKPGDPLHAPLESHRGEYSRQRMLATFHLDGLGHLRPATKAKTNEAVLFGGHIGCGKSTELRDYAALFKHSYTVHHLELTKTLDIHNLRFSDLLIALTHALTQTFQDQGLSLRPDPAFLNPIVDWFETRIVKQERFKDIDAELKTEVKAQGGVPFLASLMATMTAKVRGGASYREELRQEVRNGFFVLSQHFNALITHANELLAFQGQGPLLFIIDGSDKLSKEDSDTFFTGDVNQLAQIQTNLVVCAPISVLLEGSVVGQRFTRVQLPMVKIFEANESSRTAEENALIELVLKRMPIEYFDSRETVRYMVRMSGGHVRDLLRIIKAAYSHLGDGEVLTEDVARAAVRSVAKEYQRLVQQSDWATLVAIDASEGHDTDVTPDRLRLLYDLVLLEYNSYWWRSHPLVRTLPGYERAKSMGSNATTASQVDRSK